MAYDNKLRGALFVNDKKEKDSHPDYRGSVETEDGSQYWVSAWVKTPASGGEDYLSLALTPKDEAPRSSPRNTATSSDAKSFLQRNQNKADAHKPSAPQRAPKSDFDSFDDDIPF